MNWGKIGKGILGAAPLISGLLTNPIGTIADQAGKLLADKLGCEATPFAVNAAIEADPAAMVSLKEIESTERTELARINLEATQAVINAGSRDLETVNTTIQTEAQSEDPWTRRWRPFWGFCSAIAFFVAVFGIMFLAGYAIYKGKPTLLGHIPTLITSLALLFGVPGAILGVASWHRGMKQRLDSGEVGKPGIIGALANRIKRP